MHRSIYLKALFYLSEFGLVLSLLIGFYDVIFGTIGECIHVIIELVEMSFDKLIEHLFHTSPKQTEMIVFYILLVIGGFVIYGVWKALVVLCAAATENFLHGWSILIQAISTDWQALSMMNKILLVTAFLLVNYIGSFFLF